VKESRPDFTRITEAAGQAASDQQMERLYQRYYFAAEQQDGGRVLEAACGTGLGLPFLARRFRLVVGCDLDRSNLARVRGLCRDRRGVSLVSMDAQDLAFAPASFDLIMLLEALYYLPRPEFFFENAWRVLRPEGSLVVSMVNRDWPGFHPSPLCTAYHSVPELAGLAGRYFSRVSMYGGFAQDFSGLSGKTMLALRRLAATCKLIPGSLQGRARLKRIVFGKLQEIPSEVAQQTNSYTPPQPLESQGPDRRHQIIYCVAQP
jgi:SAM-dependent methyltransferase